MDHFNKCDISREKEPLLNGSYELNGINGYVSSSQNSSNTQTTKQVNKLDSFIELALNHQNNLAPVTEIVENRVQTQTPDDFTEINTRIRKTEIIIVSLNHRFLFIKEICENLEKILLKLTIK